MTIKADLNYTRDSSINALLFEFYRVRYTYFGVIKAFSLG